MAKKGFKIEHPVKWVIAGIVTITAITIYKNRAPVPRIRVLNKPKYYRSFPLTFFGETTYVPFEPLIVATSLHKCMSGLSPEYECEQLHKLLLYLNQNELRGLHNAWLKIIDNRLSVYDWMGREWAATDFEVEMTNRVMQNLEISGVGLRNAIKSPPYVQIEEPIP